MIFFLVLKFFGRLFSWIRIRIFRTGSGFLADPDPDSGKKSDPDPDKRTRIRNTLDFFMYSTDI